MFTDVSVDSRQPSAVVQRQREEEEIDPSQPNNHPILKVDYIVDVLML